MEILSLDVLLGFYGLAGGLLLTKLTKLAMHKWPKELTRSGLYVAWGVWAALPYIYIGQLLSSERTAVSVLMAAVLISYSAYCVWKLSGLRLNYGANHARPRK
jgi:hypothetical protein